MDYYQNETKQNMSGFYNEMTPVERSIASFFLSNTEKMDFSSKNISKRLYVSEAALSRFSKKCGYKGYREFIFSYEKDLEREMPKENQKKDISILTQKVCQSYSELLSESFQILKDKQIQRVVDILMQAEKTLCYGVGSSGFAAREFCFRFMRMGLLVEAVTDVHLIQMSAALAGKNSVIVAFSISGKTKEINNSIRIAKKKGAKVIYITSGENMDVLELCDEVVKTAYIKNLETGTKISPQIPMLIIIDALYSYYFANDVYHNEKKYKETLAALRGEEAATANETGMLY